jgi:hypothetical protein
MALIGGSHLTASGSKTATAVTRLLAAQGRLFRGQ